MTILIVALALWAAGFFVLPVTFRTALLTRNGRNWPGLILLHDDLPVPGAVWAQEYYEARQAWLLLPVHPLLILVGRINPKWAFYERWREIMGHEVEVWAEAALTGASTVTIRQREARDLAAYPAFAGWSPDKISALMQARSGDAQRFVRKHMDKIRAIQ